MNSKILKCTEIRSYLGEQKQDEVWSAYLAWVKTLLPFWIKAIERISDLIAFDQVKTQKHIEVAQNAFGLINDWYFKRTKYVKTRRNEIDSAISFIRNHALDNAVSEYWFAPICRNVASILRGSLRMMSESKQNFITGVAQEVYVMAGIRVFLQYDIVSFVFCLPSGMSIHTENPNDFDNVHTMYDMAAKQYGIEKEMEAMNTLAIEIWKNRCAPFAWEIPDFIWDQKIGDASKKLHYANMAVFRNSAVR